MILKNGKRIDGLGDNLPIGSVVEYNGTDIPDGWEILPGDANVYVGAEEPTNGQEVWIKQGKNIIPNISTLWEEGHYSMDNGLKAGYNGGRTRLCYLVEVKPNTTYYCNTFNQDYNFVIRAYDKNKSFTYSIGGLDNGSTFTTNSSACYLGVAIYSPVTDKLTYDEYMAMLANATIKPFICLNSYDDKNYEPYVTKEIRVGKDGVYEIFHAEQMCNKERYSDTEHIVGEWIDGRALYAKTISCGALPNTTEKKISHYIDNLDMVVDLRGMAIKDGYSFPIPFASSADSISCIHVFVNNGDIVIGAGKDRTSFTQSYITIKYTKKL